MGRRKKRGFGSVSNKTILHIFGLLLLACSVLLGLSFITLFSADVSNITLLAKLNETLVGNFGGMAIFIPVLFLFAAGHFFNSKKVTFVRWGASIGLTLITVALTSLLHAGELGSQLYEILSKDFTGAGATFLSVLTLIVGVMMFFDASLEKLIQAALKSWKELAKQRAEAAKLRANLAKNQPFEEGDVSYIKDQKAPEGPSFVVGQSGSAQQLAHAQTNKQVVKDPTAFKPIIATADAGKWIYPPISLLADPPTQTADRGDIKQNAHIIEKTLSSFGVKARVAEVNPGPTITQYALEISVGTNLSKITEKAGNLALALASPSGSVRIEAPIPGRSLVGIEIPNKKSEIVSLKRLLTAPVFNDKLDPLTVPLGLDVAGLEFVASIAKMPHALIAGTTGSGKSVSLNSWITTFLMRTRPDELRLILVDPKQVEMVQYNGAPHLLTEVITDPSKVVNALKWAVGEMEARYTDLKNKGVRNLEGYNILPDIVKKPFIVFIIDELADLMMNTATKSDVETLTSKLAAKSRAVGIHLVLATQRPSVNVITGVMKANIPTRIAFNVASGVDSRVILDSPGAETLVGKGDMFYLSGDAPKPRRIQGPFITEKEIVDVVTFLKEKNPVIEYTTEVTESAAGEGAGPGGESVGDFDSLHNQALEIIRTTGVASASVFQRKLKVGYARAARILDELEQAGYIGPANGSKPREILNRE